MNTHNQNEILDFGEDPVTSVSKEDVPVPQERVGQAEVKGAADVATESSTSEVTNSKISAFQLSDEGKHFMEPKIPKEDLQSQLLDLGEEIQGAGASTSCNELPGILEEEPQIDDSVIQHMKRLTPIFDAKSGIVIGEIHAQYLPRVLDKDDRTAINTAETHTSGTNTSAKEPNESQVR
ncbi:uncharacterized protein LOC134237334 [Saccostrea cucullata]|uniref:uncharacterized protein LOC134237334 n=1 Tax=Saccostrea cuccullata TaxID=36930 RepID=UPI002ED33B05